MGELDGTFFDEYCYDYVFKEGERVRVLWGRTVVRGTVQTFHGTRAVIFDEPVSDSEGGKYSSRPLTRVNAAPLNALELLAEIE